MPAGKVIPARKHPNPARCTTSLISTRAESWYVPRLQGKVFIAVRLAGLASVIIYAVVLASPLILRAVRFFHGLDVTDAIDLVLTSSTGSSCCPLNNSTCANPNSNPPTCNTTGPISLHLLLLNRGFLTYMNVATTPVPTPTTAPSQIQPPVTVTAKASPVTVTVNAPPVVVTVIASPSPTPTSRYLSSLDHRL